MKSNFKYFAVAGKPISHSRSPIIFNHLFDELKTNAYYARLLVKDAGQIMDTAKEFGMNGLNITAPFKTDILDYISSLDETAAAVNAVNTITFIGQSAFGCNTDVTGVLESFKDKYIEIDGRTALVLGAGGGAKAVIYAIKDKVKKITVLNRTIDKAKELAEAMGVEYDTLDHFPKYATDVDLIISTLSENVELDYSLISKYSVVFDANYHRPQQISNFNYISGEAWLVNQAIESYKLFTWLAPDKRDFINAAKKNQVFPNNIVLIGFSGAGKSTMGKLIADKLGMNFVDIDEEILKQTNSTINKIFEERSEYEFRNKEMEMIESYRKAENTVFATGGGAIEFGEAREMLIKLGMVIYLYAPFDISMKRADKENRPKLRDDIEMVKKLYDKRKKLYFTTSDLMMNTKYDINENLELLLDDIKRDR